MKEITGDLVVKGFFGQGNVRGIATDVFDGAIEIAAAMQEQRSTERYGYDKYQDAAAIRKLKTFPNGDTDRPTPPAASPTPATQ